MYDISETENKFLCLMNNYHVSIEKCSNFKYVAVVNLADFKKQTPPEKVRTTYICMLHIIGISLLGLRIGNLVCPVYHTTVEQR